MEAPPAPASAIPRRLGRYEIVRRLGSGGMGEVFEGRHVELGKRVAVKVMQDPNWRDQGATGRLLREGRAASAIRHPNVVTILDVGIDGGTPYLVMELLEGEDLAQRLARTAPFSVQLIADVILPVLSGMAAVHAAGIIHRDLKPSNIFLARRHRGDAPVVVDFGISKFTQPSGNASYATGSRAPVGTLRYMAPEQLHGGKHATTLSDQYALGTILYECATGGTPFWGDDRYELLHAIMSAPLLPPSELNPSISGPFDAVVTRALARDPGDRFTDLRALGAALLPLAGTEARVQWASDFGGTREHGGFTDASATCTSSGLDSNKATRARRLIASLGATGVAGVLGFATLTRSHPPIAESREESSTGTVASFVDVSGPIRVTEPLQSFGALAPASPPSPPVTVARSPFTPRSGPSAASSPHRAVPPSVPGLNGVLILEVE